MDDQVTGRAVIFDIDGTLADVRPFHHFLDPTIHGWKDWERFYGAAAHAAPIAATLEGLRAHRAAGDTIIVLTARSSRRRAMTLQWLVRNGIPFDRLVMRRAGDLRRDYVAKREILAQLRREFTIEVAWEDNPRVTATWQEEGLRVEVVPTWDHARQERLDRWHRITPKHLHGGQESAEAAHRPGLATKLFPGKVDA